MPGAENVPVPTAKEPATLALLDPYEKAFGPFTFTVPKGWLEVPPKSSFLIGEFSVSGAAGPARVTISVAGGGIQANFERWKGQFQAGPNDRRPEESKLTVGSDEVSMIDLVGTFTDGFAQADGVKANWRMLGAAIPVGDQSCFIKMTGPKETVAAKRDEFVNFVQSARVVSAP